MAGVHIRIESGVASGADHDDPEIKKLPALKETTLQQESVLATSPIFWYPELHRES